MTGLKYKSHPGGKKLDIREDLYKLTEFGHAAEMLLNGYVFGVVCIAGFGAEPVGVELDFDAFFVGIGADAGGAAEREISLRHYNVFRV